MSLIEKEELVKKIADAISWYRVHSSMIMERQLNYDKEIEVLTTMMSSIAQTPTADAIPIEWLKHKRDEHCNDGFAWIYEAVIDEWRKERK